MRYQQLRLHLDGRRFRVSRNDPDNEPIVLAERASVLAA